MRPEYWTGVFALGWLIVAGASMGAVSDQVQQDLTKKIGAKLKEVALDNWKFKVEGLDVILTGPKRLPGQQTHPEEPSAIDCVKSVPGVREVIEVRYAEMSTSKAANMIWFEIRRTGDEVRVSGDFSDLGQKDRALLPLLEWFEDMNVNDAASIDQRLSANFDPARAVRIQSWMARSEVPNFTLRYEGGIVTVEAEVGLRAVADQIRKQVKNGFPHAKFVDELTVTGQKRTKIEIDDLKRFNRPLEQLFTGDALSEDGKAYLSRVAPILASAPVKIKVGVHVDPTQSQPLAWSKQRATDVRDYLVSVGAPSKQIQAEGFGAKIPNPGGVRRRVTFEAVSL